MTYLEYKKKLGFQGSFGANSHLVSMINFPNAKYQEFYSFEEVFAAVSEGQVNLGILPIENSYAGRVAEIHNLLKNTSLYIVGEFFLPIRHFVAALPSSDISRIKKLYSHPQALMQCNENIKKYGFLKFPYENTALAAKYVEEKQDEEIAAICSELAAELHGLKILLPDFQDVSDNRTIFVAIARNIDELPAREGKKMTTLLFTIRNIPAAIYKALGGFATNGVNIVKLESYIPGGLSKEAQFFISFEGDTSSKNVQYALEELGFYSKRIKLLGVYDQALERE